MSEFVKKAAIGYRPVPGGPSDPECTHVILEKEEYDRILWETVRAEQKTRDAEYEANAAVRRARDDAFRQVQKAEGDAQRSIESLEHALAAERAESVFQRGLNANLLRISRERANAARNLKPKKEHTGYVLAATGEREHRYKDRHGNWRTVMLWESVLQSPYTLDFTGEQAKKLMLDELFREDESGNWPVQKIGISGDFNGGYAEMIEDKEWREDHAQYNVMLNRRLRANSRSGYWEIVFFHTRPLGLLPDDMKAK